MRAIRITTGALLIAAVGAVLLAIGLYTETVLASHARHSTRASLRTQARLIAEAHDGLPDNGTVFTNKFASLTAYRVTLFSPDGETLADARPDDTGPTPSPPPEELWRIIDGGPAPSGTVYAAIKLRDGNFLMLSTTGDPAASPLRSIQVFLWGAFLALSALAWGVAARGWASVDRTLNRIAGVADSLREGDLQARVREGRNGALGELTASVNGAIEEIASSVIEARAQGRYYAAILDQMTDAVVAVDERGHVQFVNRPFARLFHVEPQEAAGRPLENVALNYDLGALVNRALQQGTVQRDRLDLTHPADYLLEGVSTPLTDEGGEVIGAVALLHDITQIREANRVRQDFVANASHELRTPAAGIKALAEALQAGAINDPERGPKFCRQIVEAADRLTEILDDMLTLTRVEKGARLIEPRTTDATTALEDAANQVRPAAAQKGLTVTTETGDGDRVHADPDSLQTLLLNLLDNAVKYTPEGGAVTARGREVPGGYEFSIADTGVGIPEEHLERIFERFYRVDRARDRATGSTGLGLSIVKHIAKAHGGRVKVSSREGRGSTFTAFFPGASE